jgi:hypothetical protein
MSAVLQGWQDNGALQCTPATALVPVPELPEGSGVASSLNMRGHFWAHNDSGEPVLVLLDGSGKVAGRLQVPGAQVEDWEAVAVGPCPGGACVYVGDIGDNDAERDRITVYRIAEPSSPTASVKGVDVFHARYPDGAHDAEALLVSRDGRLHVVTKGDTGAVAIYRFPNPLQVGVVATLERVGPPREAGKPKDNARITDGAVSPDGELVVLRSNHALTFYRASDLLAGNWREAGHVDRIALREPQGEGVAFADQHTLVLVSEGGGKSRPGTFARLTCKF